MGQVIAQVLAALLLLSGTACLAGRPSVLLEPPQSPTKEQRFLFYMHGAWIERAGLSKTHPEYGRYEYGKIVKDFSEKGFTPRTNTLPIRQVRQDSRQLQGSL